jgi:serine/threonine protein kinase
MSTVRETPPQIPDHELVRRVGQGSYGDVWLAKNVMGTWRAIKVVRREIFTDDRPYERELKGIQKFEPVSRSHPGLVAILHVGRNVQGGYFYYVMELADDAAHADPIDPEKYVARTLAQELSQRKRLPVEDTVRIILPLTSALGYLHQRGLIHRDIKPSNIIFVHGVPKFADIGLVTDIGEQATMVGTFGYIPAEGPGAATADVYSLGKVLYQISTGQAPEKFPELPDALREFPDAAALMRLNRVMLKACEHRPDRRFQTAEQLHAALIDLQSGLPAKRDTNAVVEHSTAAAAQLRVVVLSHPTDDREREFVERIGEDLAGRGCDIFLDDVADLSVEWAREIEHRINKADAMVVALGGGAHRSPCFAYAVETAHRASHRGKAAPQLFAVQLQSNARLPKAIEIALNEAKHFTAIDAGSSEQVITELSTAVEAVICLKENAQRC